MAIRLSFCLLVLQGIISQENPRESKEFAKNSITSALLVSNFGIAELTLGRLTIALSCDIKDFVSFDIYNYRKLTS